MKGLLLDTSDRNAFIALSDDGTLSSSFVSSSKSSSTLVADIKGFLEKAGVALSSLHYIAIGIGPGSFLGTRIGVIIAKSLAYGLKIPIVSFCSLQAYSVDTLGSFFVLSDAKSKGVYLLKGTHTSEGLSYEDSPSLYSAQELKTFLDDTSLFVTPHQEVLLRTMPFLAPYLKTASVSLPFLCDYCYKKISSSQIETLDSLHIHYLRLS